MTDAATAIERPLAPDAPTNAASAKPFRLPLPGLWVFIVCLALALICNAAALRGEGYIGAESTLVRDNDLLNRLPGLQAMWFGGTDPSTYPLPQYAPLAQTMFFIEHTLWGDTLWLYRLVSVLLHAGVGVMIWVLLRRLAVPGAFVAALLFVAHPMTVDSVAWIAERRNPLAALLGLASVYLLLRASGTFAVTVGKLKLLPDDPKRLYAMGALLFVLALFANATIATLPLVVLLIAWWKRDQTLKPSAALTGTCVALLLIGIGMLALSSNVEKARAGVLSPAAWNRASTNAGELAIRTQIAGRAVAFYAGKLVVPHPISIAYPRWQTPRDVEQFLTFNTDPARVATRTPDVSPGDVLQYLFPISVIAILVGLWWTRDRIGRAPFVGAAAFVLLLAPSLGFIDLGWMRYSFVANRATYLASVPFIAAFVWVGSVLLAKAKDQTVIVTSAGIVVVILTILSVMIARRFRTPQYFWVQNARAYPTFRAWMPRYELARSLLNEPDPVGFRQAKQAVEELRRSRPEEPGPLVLRGLLKQREGDEVGAIADFETSMETFPSYAPAYFEAADSFRRQADAKPTDPLPRLRALQLYYEAATLDPLDATARARLGRTAWEVARRMDPADPNINKYFNEALEAFNIAVALRPYDVDLLVGVAATLVEMQRLDDAAGLLESARTISPRRADLYVVIADAALARGLTTGADASLRAAIEFDPTMIAPRIRMATLRQSQERWTEAREQLNKILELAPEHPEAKRMLSEIDVAATTRPGT